MSDITEQNEILVEQLLAGSISARNKLIETNCRLVYTTVMRILHSWPNCQYLHDDLIGEGMLALVRAVDRLMEIGEARRPIRNYLITAIRSKLLTELEKQTKHHQMHRYVDSYHKIPDRVLAADDPIFAQIENDEFLLSCCSKREREILTHYLEGKSPSDIIKDTDYSKNVVYRTLQQFREKLQNSSKSMSESVSI